MFSVALGLLLLLEACATALAAMAVVTIEGPARLQGRQYCVEQHSTTSRLAAAKTPAQLLLGTYPAFALVVVVKVTIGGPARLQGGQD